MPIEIVIQKPGTSVLPGDADITAGDSRHRALDIVRQGIPPLTAGDVPRRVVIAAAAIPTFDDMLAATLAAHVLQGETLPKSAEVFAQYAALARGGYSPGRVPADVSIEGIYQAICWPFGMRFADDSAPAGFVSEWNRMAQVLWQAMSDGGDPYTQQLFSESKGFAREIVSLRSDRQVYDQDVKAGIRQRIHLPGAAKQENSALILRNPRSLLFKLWARADAHSPTGDGYLVLGVQRDSGNWIFSTDPAQRISLKPLADALDEAEQKKGGAARWFDGAPFQHSLVAAPQAGTVLKPADVLAIFDKWAAARSAAAPSTAAGGIPRRPLIAAATLLLLAGLGWWGYQKLYDWGYFDPSRNAIELDQVHVRSIRTKGNPTAGNLAMFTGVNDFFDKNFAHLDFPVDDAIAQAHLFVIELELIPPANTILALEGEPATARARKQLKELLAGGVQRTKASRANVFTNLDTLQALSRDAGGHALLIMSFSSHGREDNGQYIIPYDGVTKDLDQTAISVAYLNDRMAHINADKRLLLVDACRLGPAAASKGEEQKMTGGFLAALEAAKGENVMASCNQGEASYENTAKGHGIFTYWLLMGLKGGDTGASCNSKGMITVGTLEEFLTKKVPHDSLMHASGVQNPWFSDNGGSQDIPLAVSESP